MSSLISYILLFKLMLNPKSEYLVVFQYKKLFLECLYWISHYPNFIYFSFCRLKIWKNMLLLNYMNKESIRNFPIGKHKSFRNLYLHYKQLPLHSMYYNCLYLNSPPWNFGPSNKNWLIQYTRCYLKIMNSSPL